MSNPDTTSLVHVVGTVNLDEGTGEILYVLPSNVASSKGAVNGDDKTLLIVRNGAGEEIVRVHPQLRLQACRDEEDPRIGLIQHDLPVDDSMASVELNYDGKALDTFEPETGEPEMAASMETMEMGLGQPTAGAEHRTTFSPGGVGERKGVSYLVQAKPDNAIAWSTISVGKKQPEFEVDKNQFPGAKSVEVRIVRQSGFKQSTIQERKIPLE